MTAENNLLAKYQLGSPSLQNELGPMFEGFMLAQSRFPKMTIRVTFPSKVLIDGTTSLKMCQKQAYAK